MAKIENTKCKRNYLVLLVGNIGTGKTTFRKKLEKKKKRRLFDCPDEYEDGNDVEQRLNMGKKIEYGLNNGFTVIIDGPHMKCGDRNELLLFAKNAKCKSIIFDFGSGNYETLNRRIKSNSKLSAEEWKEIHENNIKDYERPEYDTDSCDRIIRIGQQNYK